MQVSLVLQLTPQVHLLFRLRRASSSGVTHQLRPDLLQVLMDTARLPQPFVWTRRQRSCKAKPRRWQPALAEIVICVIFELARADRWNARHQYERIILRQLGSYKLPYALRMTIGLEEENRATLEAIREFKRL